MIFEQSFERLERTGHADVWGKSILGRGNNKYEDPETRVCLVSRMSNKEVLWPDEESKRQQEKRPERRGDWQVQAAP